MNISRKFVTGLLGGIAATLFVSGVQAAPITIPVGLNPGDTYRLVFVTSTRTDATSSDVNYYNNFVDTLGFAGTGISGWTAIVSTSTQGTGTHARDNTNTNFNTDLGTSIYTLYGNKIADDNADLWDGSLDNFIAHNETGVVNPPSSNYHVWTGTQLDGTRFPTGGLGGGGLTGTSTHGNWNVGGGGAWINYSSIAQANSNPYYLFGISGILTVAEEPTTVSAPAGLAIFGLSLIGLVYMRRKRAG